jgi:hypothetical protein
MKLTYWVADSVDDDGLVDHYNPYRVRTRTKKEAVALVKNLCGDFTPIRKVDLEYKDGFDLMYECMHLEYSGYWERAPTGACVAHLHDSEATE